MNIVAIVGNVASEPELRHTDGGKAVCSFRVAVSRPGAAEADFFTVVCWERQAEVAKEYIHVGRRIAVDGRLRHSTWQVEAKDGSPAQRRSKVEIIAHRVELVSKTPTEAEAAASIEVTS